MDERTRRSRMPPHLGSSLSEMEDRLRALAARGASKQRTVDTLLSAIEDAKDRGATDKDICNALSADVPMSIATFRGCLQRARERQRRGGAMPSAPKHNEQAQRGSTPSTVVTRRIAAQQAPASQATSSPHIERRLPGSFVPREDRDDI
jgi:hypothetical protein